MSASEANASVIRTTCWRNLWCRNWEFNVELQERWFYKLNIKTVNKINVHWAARKKIRRISAVAVKPRNAVVHCAISDSLWSFDVTRQIALFDRSCSSFVWSSLCLVPFPSYSSESAVQGYIWGHVRSCINKRNISGTVQVWYGILEFNVPLDTL